MSRKKMKMNQMICDGGILIVTVDTDHKLGVNLFLDWFNKKYVFDLTSNVISPNYRDVTQTLDNILHPNSKLFVSIT